MRTPLLTDQQILDLIARADAHIDAVSQQLNEDGLDNPIAAYEQAYSAAFTTLRNGLYDAAACDIHTWETR